MLNLGVGGVPCEFFREAALVAYCVVSRIPRRHVNTPHHPGSFIDYTSPDAMEWWHGQMDNVLEMAPGVGVDGFKCDGTDPYVFELIVAKGAGGVISEREYADMYYGDYLNYTRSKRGIDGLIMARPVDDLWSFAPRETVFSGWVGDQDPTFDGLKSALTDFMHSAWRGYVGFGSDIGGFRCCDGKKGVIDPPFGRTVQLFTRWFQVGAFSPLMENGGDNEHRPWMFGDATLDNYRTFVDIHYELVPYMLTTGTNAYYGGWSMLKPLGIDLGPLPPSSHDYLLGTGAFPPMPLRAWVVVKPCGFAGGGACVERPRATNDIVEMRW